MKRINNQKGFTLIELLAVIIILGILMVIAIPSVSKYINDSRKSTYVTTAKQLIAGVRNLVNDGKHELFDTNVTYYIDTSCIKTESGNQSPYGKFDPAYVVVTYTGRGFNYYWTSRDDTGHGIRRVVSQEHFDEDDIETDVLRDDIKTNLGIEDREYYTVIDESTNCLKGDIYPIEGKVDDLTGKDTPVCVRATTLHNETCGRTSLGCYSTGYYATGSKGTTTITYGNDPQSTGSSLVPGDAFDCDINNDGVYNPSTERFYYLRTSVNNAVLIYYTNISNTGSAVVSTQIAKYAYDSANKSDLGPRTGYEQLPSITEWDNHGISLPGERLMLNENGLATINKGNTQTSSFTYANKAARFLTYQDVVSACGVGLRHEGDLDNCTYLMENTGYATNDKINGYWLENPLSTSTNNVLGMNFQKRYVGYTNASNTGNGVRPVIEVPLDLVSREKAVRPTIVTFNANGGTFSNGESTNEVEFYQYSRLIKNGEYMIPTREGKFFAGWKTSLNNQIYKNFSYFVATQSVTMTAQWSDASEYVCVRVDNPASLHRETCNRTNNYCSLVVGNASTITYGQIGNPGVLRAGDAFDCDLNGNGVYDERFYYVSDYFDTVASKNQGNVFDSEYGVLIYYSNFKSGTGAVNTGIAYNSANNVSQGPVTLFNDLPTTSEWSNVSLKTTDRQILTEYDNTHNSDKTGGRDLPLFSYAGKAARLLTAQEVMQGCGIVKLTSKSGELDGCTFLFEKTDYAASGRPTVSVWLETSYTDTKGAMRANSEERRVIPSNSNLTNKGLKPAIDVPKSRLLY